MKLNFLIPVTAGGLEEWISDGSCDDINNNVPCQFDGGDCCGVNVVKQYCFNCDCIGNFCEANSSVKIKRSVINIGLSLFRLFLLDDI